MSTTSTSYDSPAPGLVEFDATAMADAVLEVATAALAGSGPGGRRRHRQPASVSDACGSAPAAGRWLGIGWQDLHREHLPVLQAEGIRLAPAPSAAEVMAILDDGPRAPPQASG